MMQTWNDVVAAAKVRQAELGAVLLQAEAEVLPTHEYEQAILDLRLGLELVATESDPGKRELLTGYLIEAYGLNAVAVDPFLRPVLPAIPATGTRLRYRILSANNRLLRINGRLVVMGVTLAPSTL